MDYTFTTLNVMALHITIVIMPVCMASYMIADYVHANLDKFDL